jgi:phosphoserine phosphatase
MSETKDFMVMTVTGEDKPGITSAFTRIFLENNCRMLGVEQASLQDFLGLSFMLDMSGAGQSGDGVIKDLLFEASGMGLNLQFRLVSEIEVRARSEANLFILTTFGGTRALAKVSTILAEENANIERITNLSHDSARWIEITVNVRGVEKLGRMKKRLMAESCSENIDLALQKIEAYRKNKRLVFFDMDNTLIDMEVIDAMAAQAGVEEEVSRITEKAMRGEIDFEESLEQRVALMRGLTLEKMEIVRDQMKLSEGAEELISSLRKLGYQMGIISGGFHYYADHLKDLLGLDFAYANRLKFKDGELTGRVDGRILDGAEKAKILNRVARERGVLLDQTIAIGDGANDFLMLGQAGFAIAYNAKSKLDGVAHGSLRHTRLLEILHLLGISDLDLEDGK